MNNIYKREVLYKEVWDSPITKVAKKYGVSDVAIHKICKRMNIPSPPRGYWAKLVNGRKVRRSPLPKDKDAKTEIIGKSMKEENKKSNNNSKPLSFMKGPERQKILLGIKNVTNYNENSDKLKIFIGHKSKILKWNSKKGTIEGRTTNPSDYMRWQPSDYPLLGGVISKELIPRAFRILDRIFKIIIELGGKINPDLTMEIRGQQIPVYISEMQSSAPYIPNKDEQRQLDSYKERLEKGDKYLWKPNIRKYENKFNGRLRISPRENVYYWDSASENGNKIEDQLEYVIIDLYEKSEIIRLDKIKKHRAECLYRKRERQRDAKKSNIKKELNRIKSLENEASDFDMACKIRRYIDAVEDKKPSLKSKKWIEWAKMKADWYDPTIKNKDPQFGFRKSWKASEKKAPNKDYWNYY